MFAQETLVVKPKKRVDELVAEGRGQNFDAGKGKPMQEWIAIDSDGSDWVKLAKEAYRFVSGA